MVEQFLENARAASLNSLATAASSRCRAKSLSRKIPSTLRVRRCPIRSRGEAVLRLPWAAGFWISPWVRVHSKTGSESSPATASRSFSTRSSSTVSMAITGWKESTRVRMSWMLVETPILRAHRSPGSSP